MTLENVEWSDCLLEPRRDEQLESFVKRELGVIPTAVPYLAASPWIVQVMVSLLPPHLRLVHVSYDLAELVGLVVSQDNSCRYCYATQRVLLRMQGMPEHRIRQLEHDFLAAEISPAERVALEFARHVSRASPLAGESDRERLRAVGYEDPAINELAFLAAVHVFANRLTTLIAVPPARMESLARNAPLGWLAPALRVVHALRRTPRGKAASLPADRHTGPYADLVLALDGLPAALELRSALDRAFASGVVGLRAKLLTFAVVARGLGCALSEETAATLLRGAGTPAEEVAAILEHLSSPALDAVERAVVPFARETIRYRPIEIQRRAREVRDRLSAEQFLEIIGVVALANAVCRLGVVSRAR